MVLGFFIIFLFYFLGESASFFLSIPIPGSVLGMMFLFFILLVFSVPNRSLFKASSQLVKILPLLFVPVCTGMVAFLGLLKEQVLVIFVAVVLSTLLSVVACVLSMSILSSRFKNVRNFLKDSLLYRMFANE